tara:strand:- start:723 stop:1112 length:390 start_codon:yes stop_codon:yes gene_type:complete
MKLSKRDLNIIEHYKLKEGYTRDLDFAKSLGISQEHYSRIKNGKAKFTKKTAQKMYLVLGEQENLKFLVDDHNPEINKSTTDGDTSKEEALNNVYNIHNRELFQCFIKSSLEDKFEIIKDLETIIQIYE